MYRPTSAECRAVLERLGELHTAHLDLGAALFDEGDFSAAEAHVRRALDLGHPLPGIVHNYLASIAKAHGDVEGMISALADGIASDPQHPTLIANADAIAAWLKRDDMPSLDALELSASNEFELLERALQPTLPGPLPPDFAVWSPRAPLAAIEPLRPRQATLIESRRRLRVVAP
jgi:tetratricopeptide (TPR) repeat protein